MGETSAIFITEILKNLQKTGSARTFAMAMGFVAAGSLLNWSCSQRGLDDNRLCRITESVYSSLISSRTNVGEILVYQDGTYVEHYTNIWGTDARPSLVITGHAEANVITALSSSLRKSEEWSKVDGVATYTLAIDERIEDDWASATPDGVQELFEHARATAWRDGRDRGDVRLCRVSEARFLHHVNRWGPDAETILNRAGTFIHYHTNFLEGGRTTGFVTTGQVPSSVLYLISRSLLRSQQWKKVDGVPTYTLSINDYRLSPPSGVRQLSDLVYSNVLWHSTNKNAPRQQIGDQTTPGPTPR